MENIGTRDFDRGPDGTLMPPCIGGSSNKESPPDDPVPRIKLTVGSYWGRRDNELSEEACSLKQGHACGCRSVASGNRSGHGVTNCRCPSCYTLTPGLSRLQHRGDGRCHRDQRDLHRQDLDGPSSSIRVRGGPGVLLQPGRHLSPPYGCTRGPSGGRCG